MKYEKGFISDDFRFLVAGLLGIAFVVWIIASWLTHIIVCLGEEAWGFLIAGAIMVPIAVIHGTGIWFGWF